VRAALDDVRVVPVRSAGRQRAGNSSPRSAPVVYGKGPSARAGWEELKTAIEEKLRDQLDEAQRAIPADVAAEATLASGDPALMLSEAGRAPGRCCASARVATDRSDACCSGLSRQRSSARRRAR
jgi:hypothetical protein